MALALLALAGSGAVATAQRTNVPEGVGEGRAAPHATPGAQTAPAPTEPPRADASAPPPRSIAEEVRALRTEVEALGRRAEPATEQDVERLRAAIVRLESAQRDLARRIDDRMVPPPSDPDPPAESSHLAPLWFVIGAAIGGVASRMLQRRRDVRQRSRLRL